MGGLGTDAQTFSTRLQFLHNLYKLREERDIAPTSFGSLVSSEQYSRRFGPYFVSPVIAGLSEDGEPYVDGFDSIGAGDGGNEFAVAGTAPEGLYGMCESLWKPGLEADELFETISQCMLGSVEVDSMAGWGAVVYVITMDKVIVRTLKTRMD